MTYLCRRVAPLCFVYFIVLGTNITFKRQVGINVDLDDKTPHGVFMKVGELGRGGWFVSLIFIGTEKTEKVVQRAANYIHVHSIDVLQNSEKHTRVSKEMVKMERTYLALETLKYPHCINCSTA